MCDQFHKLAKDKSFLNVEYRLLLFPRDLENGDHFHQSDRESEFMLVWEIFMSFLVKYMGWKM